MTRASETPFVSGIHITLGPPSFEWFDSSRGKLENKNEKQNNPEEMKLGTFS